MSTLFLTLSDSFLGGLRSFLDSQDGLFTPPGTQHTSEGEWYAAPRRSRVRELERRKRIYGLQHSTTQAPDMAPLGLGILTPEPTQANARSLAQQRRREREWRERLGQGENVMCDQGNERKGFKVQFLAYHLFSLRLSSTKLTNTS